MVEEWQSIINLRQDADKKIIQIYMCRPITDKKKIKTSIKTKIMLWVWGNAF